MDVPINIIAGTLPTGAVYNPQTYFNAIVARMTASIAGGNVVFGQLGGSEPNAPLPGNGDTAGLWFGTSAGNDGIWQAWNADAAKYLPIPVVCGQYVNSVVHTTEFLCGAIKASYSIVTPDKGGTLALLDDLLQSFGTQSISTGANLSPDWTNRASFYVVLTTNMTVAFPSHTTDGQIMDMFFENPSGSTDYTVTFAGPIRWPARVADVGGTVTAIPAGTPPVMSPHVAGQRVVDHYQFRLIGNIMFGSVVDQNFQIALTADNHAPVVVQPVTGSGNQIDIEFDWNLRGGSIPVADFVVIKNGTTQSLTNAIYAGTTVAVNLDVALKAADKVTIKYTGVDIVSIAGIKVAPFGPLNVNIVTRGGDGHPPGGGGVFNHYIP